MIYALGLAARASLCTAIFNYSATPVFKGAPLSRKSRPIRPRRPYP
jgi:hypothetical protein